MTANPAPRNRSLTIAIIITAVLIVVVGAVFLAEVFTFRGEAGEQSEMPADLEERAAALIAMGDADRGAPLMDTYQCAACHVIGAQNNIAPAFDGLADVAAQRSPPLSAAAYIYQSIIDPGAHIVEGYQNAMAQNFADRVSEQELADMLVYLLERTGGS
jgi:mono/diheme cytochrome c family protein